MTDIINRLGLELDTQGLRGGGNAVKALASSMLEAERRATSLEGASHRVAMQLQAVRSLAATLSGVLAAAFSVGKVIEYADAWRGVTNQLRLVTESTSELAVAQRGVFDISQQTFTLLENNAAIYTRLTRFASQYAGSQQEVLRLTRTISELASISGAPLRTQEMGIYQLTQGLALGVLRGQDLRAVIEDIPTLAEAIAKGMGKSTEELRRLGHEGVITSEAIIHALQNQAEAADEAFSRITPSIGQAMVVMKNALAELFGTQLNDVFAGLAKSIIFIADHLEDIYSILVTIGVASAVAFAPKAIQEFSLGVIALVTQLTSWLELQTAVATGNAVIIGSQQAVALSRLEDAKAAEVEAADIMMAARAQHVFANAVLETAAARAAERAVRGGASASGVAATVAQEIEASRRAQAGATAALAAAEAAHATAAARVATAEAQVAKSMSVTAIAGRALSGVWKLLVVAFEGLLAIISANPFTAVVVGITAAITALALFKDDIILVKKEIEGLGEVKVSLGDYVGAFFSEVGERFIDKVIHDFDQFKKELGNIGQLIGDILGPQVKEFLQDFTEGLFKLPQIIAGVFGGMVEVVKATLSHLPQIWDNIWTSIVNLVIARVEQISNAIIDALNLAKRLQIGGNLVPDIPHVQLQRVQGQNFDAGQMAGEAFTRGYETGVGNFEEAMAGLQKEWDDFWQDVDRRATQSAIHREFAPTRPPQPTLDPDTETNKRLARQIRDRAEMFAELEARRAAVEISEREAEIVEITHNLLQKWPELYAQSALGAEKAARADAERVYALQRQIKAGEQRLAIERQITEEVRRATRVGSALQTGDYLQVQIAEAMADLQERNRERYEVLGDRAEEVLRHDAERLVVNQRIQTELDRQANRLEEIANWPVRFQEGLEKASDDFWTNFVNDAESAFDKLGSDLKNVFKQLQADILRAVFDPVLQGFRQAIAQAIQSQMGNIFGGQGGGFNLGNIFSVFSSNGGAPLAQNNWVSNMGGMLGSNRSQGGGFSLGSIFGGSGFNLGSIFGPGFSLGGAGSWAGNAGGMLGSMSAMGSIVSSIGTAFVMSQLGSGMANALGLVKKQAGGQVGGMVGGTIGAFVGGPIGSAIGSFIGSTIGGLFGPGVQSGLGNLSMGRRGSITKAPWGVGGNDELAPETAQALTEVAGRIREGMDLLKQLGGTSSIYISRLALASEREQSSYGYSSTSTGQVINNDVNIGSVGDPNALASAALREVLSHTDFANPILDTVKDIMMQIPDKPFEDILESLGKLNDVLPKSDDQTSQWEEALKSLNDTFAELRSETEGVTGAAAQLDSAFASAMEALKTQFNKDIEDAILGIENPLALQLEEMFKNQAQRIQDAQSLGGDMSRVSYLNSLELEQFIKNAGNSAEAFLHLNEVFDELIAKATAAGQATGPLVDAFNTARQGVRDTFNEDIGSQLRRAANPTLAALTELLEQQQERLEQAQAIGANVVAVERLNAVEQSNFFRSLSEEQRRQLGDYLGLIEDYTGQIAVVLQQLNDELSARIDDMDKARQEYDRQAETFHKLADAIGTTKQDLNDKYGALTPQQGIENLRARLVNLGQQGQAGNESALTALPQVADQLIQASRGLYGSTTAFRNDFDLVQRILGEAQSSAEGRALNAEEQSRIMVEQRDTLIQIRDLLQQAQPAFDALQIQADKLSGDNGVVALLLQQYLDLQQANQTPVVDQALVTAAMQAAVAGALNNSLSVTLNTPGSEATAQYQEALLNSQAIQIDLQEKGFKAIVDGLVDLKNELRRRSVDAAA